MKSVMESTCLLAALDYLAMGWSALPLCPPDHRGMSEHHCKTCKSPGKAPWYPWADYQKRLPKERELRLWWDRVPTANVGVVMGRVSGLVGLDIDGPEAMDILREINGGEELESSLEFLTPGGGRRVLFRLDEGASIPKQTFRRGASHVIILGEGSLTVMPPSVHKNGSRYG